MLVKDKSGILDRINSKNEFLTVISLVNLFSPQKYGVNSYKSDSQLVKDLVNIKGKIESYYASCGIFGQLFWKYVVLHCHETVKFDFC